MRQRSAHRGRGVSENPANRFERLHYEPESDSGFKRKVATQYLRDVSRRVISRNDSPDVGFEFSLNPYRGCEHGCSYCYARPTHEYLGFSAGLDFETRILVKEGADSLLRRELSVPGWKGAPLALSGVTDAYQPIERSLGITRACLEVLAEYLNPVIIVTKNYLVVRDLDPLRRLAREGAAIVTLSLTTLRADLQRSLEPRASTPRRRLEAIRLLSEASIPVRVLLAPVIPGLNDHELPALLEAASEAGATSAGYVLLRLPHGLKALFSDWLQTHVPERASRVLSLLRDSRGGSLYASQFHQRMKGSGPYAEQIHALFGASCRRLGLNRSLEPPSSAAFRVPGSARQMGLF